MRIFYTLFIFVLIVFTGCVSNYNLEVIREARVFALAELPELSDASMHCIKFTTPRLADTLLYSRDSSSAGKNDITQTVVIWDLPDQDGKSLMVVGYGQRDLHDWNPNRVILKHFRGVKGNSQKFKKRKKRSASAAKNGI